MHFQGLLLRITSRTLQQVMLAVLQFHTFAGDHVVITDCRKLHFKAPEASSNGVTVSEIQTEGHTGTMDISTTFCFAC